MSDIVEAPTHAISAQTAEHVLATGDLSKLTAQQRVEYVMRICEAMGINPLTRPIRFLRLGPEIQAYFTRDGTDQLRKLHNISLHVIDQKTENGVLQVRVQARMPNGREDEDIGAVVLPQGGDFRANAMMKCITKAKRRVTLSICGLGFLSEDELETMPGVRTFDASEPTPTPEPPQTATGRDRQAAEHDSPKPKTGPERPGGAWRGWVDTLQTRLVPLTKLAAQEELGRRITENLKHAPDWAKEEVLQMFADAKERALRYEAGEIDAPEDDLPPIAGEENLAAG